MEIITTLTNAVIGLAQSPYAVGFLFLLAFAESSFFPIPPDTLLIPLALANPGLAAYYALVCTIGSVTGGSFGFWVGRVGGRPILRKFVSEAKILLVKSYYNKYDIWAILVAALTPIPYKIFTISAGSFEISFKRFLLASVVGRGGRFFSVGIIIMIFGPVVKELLKNYFEAALILFTVLLVGGFFVVDKFAHKVNPTNEQN